MPETISEERLRELEEVCNDPKFGKAVYRAVLVSTDELRELLACAKAVREIQQWTQKINR